MNNTIVLDVRLPFRHSKDLEGRPSEGKALVAQLKRLERDARAKSEWKRLLADHAADEVWFQAYRQDPRHPFEHAKSHVNRGLKGDLSAPADPKGEPAQKSGQSGLLVATVHFPRKQGVAREDKRLGEKADDFLSRLEDILGPGLWEHAKTHGYRALNARAEEYEDLNAVKHRSVSFSASADCGFGSFSISGDIGLGGLSGSVDISFG